MYYIYSNAYRRYLTNIIPKIVEVNVDMYWCACVQFMAHKWKVGIDRCNEKLMAIWEIP